jgi:hypothetical protein
MEMIAMTEYLQQLQADHTTLEKMLEERRSSLTQLDPAAGDPLELKAMRPSVKLLHQAYLYILEDALGILKSLIEYFTPQPQKQ